MKEELEVTKERSVLIPFLVGGLVGAGVALLLAPKSGKELRKDITDIAANARDKVVTAVERGKERYVESTEAVKNAVEAAKIAYNEEMKRLRKTA